MKIKTKTELECELLEEYCTNHQYEFVVANSEEVVRNPEASWVYEMSDSQGNDIREFLERFRGQVHPEDQLVG